VTYFSAVGGVGGVRHEPFEEGGLRLCYHFFDVTDGVEGAEHQVGKESRYVEAFKLRLAFHTQPFRCLNEATHMAKRFNHEVAKVGACELTWCGIQGCHIAVTALPRDDALHCMRRLHLSMSIDRLDGLPPKGCPHMLGF
jgi:hypothetical protein